MATSMSHTRSEFSEHIYRDHFVTMIDIAVCGRTTRSERVAG
jgi:hypothetical protein